VDAERLHRPCGCAIGAHAELILALDLEQVRDLVEDARDIDVLDRASGGARRRTGGTAPWMRRRRNDDARSPSPGHDGASSGRDAWCLPSTRTVLACGPFLPFSSTNATPVPIASSSNASSRTLSRWK
jgi:hypothetical protein